MSCLAFFVLAFFIIVGIVGLTDPRGKDDRKTPGILLGIGVVGLVAEIMLAV